MKVAAGPVVGIGQLAVSGERGVVISALGLGSCIGLVLADTRARVAGMVHVMLPDSATAATDGPPGKYADTAVPALIDALCRLGAQRDRLSGAMAGGAQMFGGGSGGGVLRIGERNTEAVRVALHGAGIRLRAADTGGSQGRSLHVDVETGRITVRAVGGEPSEL